jgi:hypothetical protein
MASSSSSVGACGSPLPAPMAVSPADSSDSREPAPEYDLTAAHNAVAPPHWNAEDFGFDAPWSEDDASLTEGEADLQFLVDGELEEDGADDHSWEGDEDSDDGIDDSIDSGTDEDSDADSGEGGEDNDDDDGGEDDTDDDEGDGANSSSNSGEDGDDDLPLIKRYQRSRALD